MRIIIILLAVILLFRRGAFATLFFGNSLPTRVCGSLQPNAPVLKYFIQTTAMRSQSFGLLLRITLSVVIMKMPTWFKLNVPANREQLIFTTIVTKNTCAMEKALIIISLSQFLGNETGSGKKQNGLLSHFLTRLGFLQSHLGFQTKIIT